MKKIIYILFLYSSFIFSQIKLEIKFINSKQTVKGRLVELCITNNSDINYILPVDTTDFKTFYVDEGCVNFSDLNDYSDLMLKVNFNTTGQNLPLMSFPHYTITGQLDEKDQSYIKEFHRRDSLRQLQNKEMKLWKEQNEIQQTDIWAYKNKMLMSNLLFIKAKKQIKFYKYFNPKKFNVDFISGNYDYFNLQIDNEYEFSLKYCIDYEIYQFLTKKQTNEIESYALFSGNLESNVLKWKE